VRSTPSRDKQFTVCVKSDCVTLEFFYFLFLIYLDLNCLVSSVGDDVCYPHLCLFVN